jgi:glutamine synthetase
MHSFEQCKVKINGIKIVLNDIKDHAKGQYEIIHRVDSAIAMCDELLREKIDGKEIKG